MKEQRREPQVRISRCLNQSFGRPNQRSLKPNSIFPPPPKGAVFPHQLIVMRAVVPDPEILVARWVLKVPPNACETLLLLYVLVQAMLW